MWGSQNGLIRRGATLLQKYRPASWPQTVQPPAMQDLGPMLQSLLIDRFKVKAHYEDRLVTAHTLVAGRPRFKKADPSICTFTVASRIMTRQSTTMAQFADQLQSIARPYVHYPVVDGTGLDGGWDFSFTFSPIPANQLAALRGAPPTAAPYGIAASDPVGGTSLFEAIEKQLGLKLEAHKRPYPVLLIDHIEEKPTDN